MSLWPVSDYVTRQMMTAYYTGLRDGLGRGDARRAAKLRCCGARPPHPAREPRRRIRTGIHTSGRASFNPASGVLSTAYRKRPPRRHTESMH
jgi:hypothetical protein